MHLAPGGRKVSVADERSVADDAGAGVGFGLGAMLLTRQMLGKAPAKEEETQDVLVAARDFKEEEFLKPDMVKVIRMAKSAVPVGAFSSSKDVEDRWVKTAMLEGDVVIEKKLGPRGRRRAWSRTSPRECGPSPSTSPSNRASRASSCPATAWT